MKKNLKFFQFIKSIYISGNKSRFAFTLSEVLITLAIIGVVAALTLPSVINNYQKQVTARKLQKAYNTFLQAIEMSKIDNGDIKTWNFPEGSSDSDGQQFFNTYFKPYLNCIEYYKSRRLYSIDNMSSISLIPEYELPDGTRISTYTSMPSYIWIFIDINGKKGPNKLGRDVFMLWLRGQAYAGVSAYKFQFAPDNTYYNGYICAKGTNKKYAGGNCGYLIMQNNWKIPDNYPW